MFHALIQTYADALYVAMTLRPPASALPGHPKERLADGDERSPAPPSGPLSGRIAGWLRTRSGRGFAATTAPALRPLPKI
jgi:hypothetical protein